MINFFQTIWTTLGNIALLHWIWISIVSIGAFSFYFWRYIAVQLRFGNNLRRNIYFIKTSEEKKLIRERDTLAKLKMFNLIEDIKDISTSIKDIHSLERNAVYIIGYSKQYNQYNELIQIAENFRIPIIFFANFNEITSEHRALFNDSMFCDVANTSRRLAIILLNTLKIV